MMQCLPAVLFYGSTGLVTTEYGPYWGNIRKFCISELLSSSKIQSYVPLRKHELGLLVESIKRSAIAHDVVDLGMLTSDFMESITFKMILGGSKEDRFDMHRITRGNEIQKPKAKKCIFVGYDQYRKGWRCMDPMTKKFTTSRDVIFDEISPYYSSSQLKSKIFENDDLLADKVEDFADAQDDSPPLNHDNSKRSGTNDVSEELLPSNSENKEQVALKLRKSNREKKEPAWMKNYAVHGNQGTVTECFFIGPCDSHEPSCFEEARNHPKWEEAMQEEISALKKNNTSVDRYKARLVARGFSQHYGLDYEETFSPVAKMTNVRTIISLAAHKGWKLWQLDVKNAFLYGDLDREIFMEQPQGFVSCESPHHVCRLKKALYGLKQAPRAWYGKISEYLSFCGFKISNSDSSMFVKRNFGVHVLVLLYVDDMIITGDNCIEITRLYDDLAVRFEMKNLGEAGCFLGLEIEQGKNGVFLSQQRYAKTLLKRFSMEEAKPKPTPMEPHIKLQKDEGKPLMDSQKFRQLVGCLIYLTITRPDLSYAVSVISQFMENPQLSHWDAGRRILRYVKSTVDYGLLYKKNGEFLLNGFVDSDWAGDINDRRSTTGYYFNMGSAAISWCSKKQPNVALSSAEAEYCASTVAAQECVWLKQLISNICRKVDYPIAMRCDNESAIKLASNLVFHARTKHIEVQHHFIQEKVLEQVIEIKNISTGDQIADVFTKALAKPKLELFRDALGLVDRGGSYYVVN
ncbi:Retrovirus-related Pol polyprotein from transposon TNT 1-94 [Quillaja saponaria]|uniref:Retrovirus-related Pol polyprotein from transposon TNT 1-94 n=1 Tax=Quillaja saponaria TaxID=32244 RepID=A0AAD7PEA1_QUISA|nr:Retrovirus-related Pol polyprotein from transposon TNT 1-94 [Quillaja saponaria]